MSETVKLSTLIPDGKNANLGTPRGNQMIEDSLRQYGAGRSILIDKHGNIVAGNKTVENAAAIGMDDVIVVQSDGTKLVAVQRTDLDLADPRTRQLAISDNRAGQVSLDWDTETLKGLVEDGVDLAPFWTAGEIGALFNSPLPNDANAEWIGMPSYENEDQSGVRQIIVHFKTQDDVMEFARLVKQNITDKTKYIWYPYRENDDHQSEKYQ